MAEMIANCPTNSTNFKEAVCVNADRVYDSCCDRDCLEDLRLVFNHSDQQLVCDAQCVRLRSAQVVYANIDVESVNFHKGYYSCTVNLYFLVSVDLSSSTMPTTTVTGIACHQKQVVLYGSEGCVKTFSNEFTSNDRKDHQASAYLNTPKCTIQVAEPVTLSARICKVRNNCDCGCKIPNCVAELIGGCVDDVDIGQNAVFVTLGLFSIIQLTRKVQILVPTYDFTFPEKKCLETNDSPCDVFRSIDFPTEDFFPVRPCNLPTECGCDNCNN